jgi:hypothetical protein
MLNILLLLPAVVVVITAVVEALVALGQHLDIQLPQEAP